MTRTKICGITRMTDAKAAIEAGADAIGLVFYAPSPRAVPIARAAEIARSVPPFVSVVGLFVNPDIDWVRKVLREVPLDHLQFHGDEDAEFCGTFNTPWLKAIRVSGMEDVVKGFDRYRRARGLLVDAYHPDRYGGTGQVFDWALIPEQRPMPLVLAGGLTSGNVAEAIRQVKPWAVDVSGGVEVAKGIKDAERIQAFIKEVHSVG